MKGQQNRKDFCSIESLRLLIYCLGVNFHPYRCTAKEPRPIETSLKELTPNEAPWELLLMADPCRHQVGSYLNKSQILGLYIANEVVGVLVLLMHDSQTAEIMNVAVRESHQRQGLGKLLLEEGVDRSKRLGAKRVLIGTGNSSLSQLALYQKIGFRLESIDRDFFTERYSEPIIENGIICKDMIKLSLDL